LNEDVATQLFACVSVLFYRDRLIVARRTQDRQNIPWSLYRDVLTSDKNGFLEHEIFSPLIDVMRCLRFSTFKFARARTDARVSPSHAGKRLTKI
jgi:hypothetical protein